MFVIRSIFTCHAAFSVGRVGMRVTSALSQMIYEKSLRLSNSARSEYNVGQLVNLQV